MEYYHNLVTEKSFSVLKDLKRKHKFILIGGWAVFLLAGNLKSKDIDLVVDFAELEKIRGDYEMTKNDRLKKYEIKLQDVDVDIYVYHFSDPGLPAEEVVKYTTTVEGFVIPRPEILIILKQHAYQERRGTPKGEKDKIDVISLVKLTQFDFEFYKSMVKKYQKSSLLQVLADILNETKEVKELNLNAYQFSKLRKAILPKITGVI